MQQIEFLPESLKEHFTGKITLRIPTHRERMTELLGAVSLAKVDEAELSTEEKGESFIKLISICEKFITKVDLTDIKTGLKIESFTDLESDLRTSDSLIKIGMRLLNGFTLGESLSNL